MLGFHWSTMEVQGDCIDHPGVRAARSNSSCTMHTLDNQNPGESHKHMHALLTNGPPPRLEHGPTISATFALFDFDRLDHRGPRAACSHSSCTAQTLDHQNPVESNNHTRVRHKRPATSASLTSHHHVDTLIFAEEAHTRNNASGGAHRFRLPRAYEDSHRRQRFRRVSSFQGFRPDFFAKSAPISLRNFGPTFRQVRRNAF